ncbi:uncharacterized protein CANTADRAFT_42672, partial [Suhomyces tanzawaensis NRRL Y-17324]
VHVIPRFYAVYLLQSIPRPQSFYVGSTPNPVRRLRQHNGELAAGAFRTKRNGARPWRMAAVVHSFPSKVAALQFEHALQHPHQTRHIAPGKRVTTSRLAGGSLHHRLANIRLLVAAPFFRRMSLLVAVLHPPVFDAWQLNKFASPEASESTWGLFVQAQDCRLQAAKSVILALSPSCAVCARLIDYIPDHVPNLDTRDRLNAYLARNMPLIAVCRLDACRLTSHLSCLAKQQLEGSSDGQIIPVTVDCASCKTPMRWTELVHTATHLRYYALWDHL